MSVRIVYELLRLGVICAARAGQPMDDLPLSWYAAAPLLILPLLLQILAAFAEDAEKRAYTRVFLLVKFVSLIGGFTFLGVNAAPALSPSVGDPQTMVVRILGVLLIFFVLDAMMLGMQWVTLIRKL